MEPGTFVQAYRRDPVRARSYGREVDGMLATARGFAVGFGRLLHDALSGRELPPLANYRFWMVKYVHWLNQSLGGLGENLEALLDALQSDEDFTRVFMELNFHRLNGSVTSWWETLLYGAGETELDRPRVTRARYELAKTAMDVIQSRDKWVEEGKYFTEDARELREWATGALTEMDGMLALLEISLRRPGTFVFPAPPQFEHMAGPANVDLIVIDPSQGNRVRGVQLKSSGSHRHVERYDADRVTLIDGRLDMYNERAVRKQTRSSNKSVESWPGLVSAHYLVALSPGRQTEGWLEESVLRAGRAAASQAAHSVVSRNAEVFDTLTKRLEADMGAAGQGADGEGRPVCPTH